VFAQFTPLWLQVDSLPTLNMGKTGAALRPHRLICKTLTLSASLAQPDESTSPITTKKNTYNKLIR